MRLGEYLALLNSYGSRTVVTNNCFWQEIQPGVFITAPGDIPVTVDKSDISRMFWRHYALVLRIIEAKEKIQSLSEQSFRYVAATRYDFGNLNKKARNQTRRGLENCKIDPIPFDRLALDGIAAYQDTNKRHGLHNQTNDDAIRKWQNQIRELSRNTDARAYAAYVKELNWRLAAFVIVFLVEDTWLISIQRSTDESLTYYPNNALIYTVTRELANEQGVRFVSYGLQSIPRNDNLHHFKISMGFGIEPVRCRILFHPFVRFFTQPPGKSLLLGTMALLHRQGLVSERNQNRVLSLLTNDSLS